MSDNRDGEIDAIAQSDCEELGIAMTPSNEQIEAALYDLEGSDFQAIRKHAATLRAALSRPDDVGPVAYLYEQNGTRFCNTKRRAQKDRAGYTETPLYAHPTNAYEKAAKVFHRQAANMAFVLNHGSMPDQWNEKFTVELEEDRNTIRAALAEGEG